VITVNLLSKFLVYFFFMNTLIPFRSFAKADESMIFENIAQEAFLRSSEFPFKNLESANRALETNLVETERNDSFITFESNLNFGSIELRANFENNPQSQILNFWFREPVDSRDLDIDKLTRIFGAKEKLVLNRETPIEHQHFRVSLVSQADKVFGFSFNSYPLSAPTTPSSYNWLMALEENFSYAFAFALYGVLLSFMTAYFDGAKNEYWQTFYQNALVSLLGALVITIFWISVSSMRENLRFIVSPVVSFIAMYSLKYWFIRDIPYKFMKALVHPTLAIILPVAFLSFVIALGRSWKN